MNEDRIEQQSENQQSSDVLKQVEELLQGSTMEGNADIIDKLEEEAQNGVFAISYRVQELNAKLYQEKRDQGENPARDAETSRQNKEALDIFHRYVIYEEMRLTLSFEKRQQLLTDLKNACNTFMSTYTV